MGENQDLAIIQQDNAGLASYSQIEIDTQIATAKQYPRDFKVIKQNILEVATQDRETAQQCFYSLPRNQRQDDGSYKQVFIEGESIRLAEIVLAFWGNIQTGTRIVEINKLMKTITVQAVVWDLERNVKTSEEITKSIGTSKGELYSQDMIIMTGKSASSQALRNAIFRAVPKVMFKSIMDQIKKASVAPGDNEKVVDMANKAVAYFTSKGVDKMKIFSFLKVTSEKEIGTDQLIILQGIKTGLTQGEFDIKDAFTQTEGEKSGKAVTTSVEDKLSKKTKKEEAVVEVPLDDTSVLDFGLPKKRKPEQLSQIEMYIDGATAQDFEAVNLGDFLGVKDLALNGTAEQIGMLIDYLTSK